MKVQFNLPNGYSADITAAKESGTFNQWIDGKFSHRVRLLITDDFTLDVRDDHFVVDFTDDDDGVAFIALIGGRKIDE
ncbi:hypothetical protein IFT59_07630 [Rhizobium sp. CFBP 8752]|uniref:hypothetical protein n=1 Tax=Rhizobium sp. CFBP 8752 TaxID=2775301 RepID=UPI001780F984|nr:hypothetical protein [Rhizobium sp. CFBP 8752]MBD8663122.1 hypothetical protein [Rhizobium sp. CFBP 8752]